MGGGVTDWKAKSRNPPLSGNKLQEAQALCDHPLSEKNDNDSELQLYKALSFLLGAYGASLKASQSSLAALAKAIRVETDSVAHTTSTVGNNLSAIERMSANLEAFTSRLGETAPAVQQLRDHSSQIGGIAKLIRASRSLQPSAHA
jgi:methyl-accepting chemotaxis protein